MIVLTIFLLMHCSHSKVTEEELIQLCKDSVEIATTLFSIDKKHQTRDNIIFNIYEDGVCVPLLGTENLDLLQPANKCSTSCYTEHNDDLKHTVNCEIEQELAILKNNQSAKNSVKNEFYNDFYVTMRFSPSQKFIFREYDMFLGKMTSRRPAIDSKIEKIKNPRPNSKEAFELIDDCAKVIKSYYIYTKGFIDLTSIRGSIFIENGIFNYEYYTCCARYCLASIELLLKATYYLVHKFSPLDYTDYMSWRPLIESVEDVLEKYIKNEGNKIEYIVDNIIDIHDTYYIFRSVQNKLKIISSELNKETKMSVDPTENTGTNLRDYGIADSIKEIANAMDCLSLTNDFKYGNNMYQLQNAAMLMLDSEDEDIFRLNCNSFVDALFENTDNYITHRYFDYIVRKYKYQINSFKV